MKNRLSGAWFLFTVLFIAALAYFSFFGLRSSEGTVLIRGAEDIEWGTDIRGGVSVTFEPENATDGQITEEQVRAAARIIALRFEDCGISSYDIYTDTESRRIIISFPWAEDSGEDIDRLLGRLSATAHLTAIEGRTKGSNVVVAYEDDYNRIIAVDARGVKHRTAVEGVDVSSARRVKYKDGGYAVRLAFSDRGRQLFLESTGRLTAYSEFSDDRYITFCLDGRPVSELHVDGAMSEGIIAPDGGFSAEDADALVSLINNGALDFTLSVLNYDRIQPALGHDPVKIMLTAGIIAFALICLFMIIRYRLPGLVACFALLGQVAGLLAAVTGFFPFIDGFTLTLPGVAGIILSIGMGVDANIITGERIAEEMRKGKTIDGAISAGSENSFSSIFDGNVTVIAVAIILMGVFGPPDTLWSWLLKPFVWMFPATTTGSVYSFGIALLVGVVFNFVMGVIASRVMLRSLSGLPGLQNRKLYGGGE